MNASQSNSTDDKKPLSDATGSQEAKEQPAEKIVIPDECGDSLWDDVLAQFPDLTMLIKKPADKDTTKGSSSL